MPYGELHPSITRDVGYFANIDRNTIVKGSPEIVCEIF
jgi:hypothetical protein